MNYLKFTPYIYLIAGLFFAYKGVMEYTEADPLYYLSFIISVAAIGMFFFRRHYAKKFENYRKDKPGKDQ